MLCRWGSDAAEMVHFGVSAMVLRGNAAAFLRRFCGVFCGARLEAAFAAERLQCLLLECGVKEARAWRRRERKRRKRRGGRGIEG